MVLVYTKLCLDGATFFQSTGNKDCDGTEVYAGDNVRFFDKWEWYKGSYAIKMHLASWDPEETKRLNEKYDAEPYEERIVDDIRDEWVRDDEFKMYWRIVGNKYHYEKTT
jgi:hypothetical protein